MALRLPIELVLNIITCSLPAYPGAILNAAHPTTKLLLTFSLVCHETRRLAVRLLRKHCVCLDSRTRLESYINAIPKQLHLREVTSLSLSPFEHNIKDLKACYWLRDLLCCTCDTLRKLVIDFPLRSCLPQEDLLGVRPLLREGFESLVNLEEFVDIQGDLYLDLYDSERAFIWRNWPKLSRMALGGASLDSTFWKEVALHSSLNTLFVSSPDEMRNFDPKAEYLKHTARTLRFVVLTTLSWRVERPDYLWDCAWETLDPFNDLSVNEYLLPYCLEGGSVRSAGARRQRLVRQSAEDGSLWSWQGREISNPIQI